MSLDSGATVARNSFAFSPAILACEVILLEHRADSESACAPRQQRSRTTLPATAEAIRAEELDFVFLATPPEVSMELAPGILAAGAKVVDLSGAFRLGSAEDYSSTGMESATVPPISSRKPSTACPSSAATAFAGSALFQPRLLSDRRQPGHPAPDRSPG